MNNPEYVEIKNKKYKINTDFRVALECNKIAEDKNIGKYERPLAIIYKLFGEEALKDFENHAELIRLAEYYLLCGKQKEQSDEKPDFDFEQDYNLVETSFMSDYKIDLSKEKMHWWKFNDLLNGLSNSELGNCCILNNIRNLRNRDLNEIKDQKERERVAKMQEKWALEKYKKENNLTAEQEESMERLNKIIGI